MWAALQKCADMLGEFLCHINRGNKEQRALAVDWRVKGWEVGMSSANLKQQMSFFQGAAEWCLFHCQFIHCEEARVVVGVVL